jgi:hypothetical protein
MELLLQLANSSFPYKVIDRSQIDLVRALAGRGYIRSYVPPLRFDPDDCARQPPAMVFEITPEGRKALDRFNRSAEAAPDQARAHAGALSERSNRFRSPLAGHAQSIAARLANMARRLVNSRTH